MVDDDALSDGELSLLSVGCIDDIAFAWSLDHLGIREHSDDPPDAATIDVVFSHFARLADRGLIELWRLEYADPATPEGRAAPRKRVVEPLDVLRVRVEEECSTADEWHDWAFSCWLESTPAGEAVVRRTRSEDL